MVVQVNENTGPLRIETVKNFRRHEVGSPHVGSRKRTCLRYTKGLTKRTVGFEIRNLFLIFYVYLSIVWGRIFDSCRRGRRTLILFLPILEYVSESVRSKTSNKVYLSIIEL